MAQTRYDIDFRVPIQTDSKGQPSKWSNSMRTIIESTDEVKAKMLLKAQYSNAQIAWCTPKR